MDAAVVGVWTGVDDAVSDDGGCGLAGVAVGQVDGDAGSGYAVHGAINAQRGVVDHLFRRAESRSSLWGNPAAVVRAGGHDGGVLAALESGDGAAGAIPGVEHVCGMPELHHLADELSRAVLRSQT